MKKLVLMVGLLLAIGAKAQALTLAERIGNVPATFKTPPTAALGTSAFAGFARTFQKSGTNNRLLAVAPLFDWGILSADVIGASPDLTNLWNEHGLLGLGGGVHVDRVLTAMFPELASAFTGPIPFTGGAVSYNFEPGVGAGYDFEQNEGVTMLFIAGGIKW